MKTDKLKKLLLFFAIAFSSVVVSQAYAVAEFVCKTDVNTEYYEPILNKVSQASARIKSLKADFVQESYLLGLDKIENSSGKVLFQKTAKMRWDYQAPEKQLFVMDGKSVWYYQPSQNQVMLSDLNASFKSSVPVSFLLGLGTLTDTFILQNACHTQIGILLNLTLKESDDSLDKFYLLVRQKDYTPLGAKIVDLGGNETSIVFKNLVLNQSIKAAEFSFVPPQGLDIIDNRNPVALPSRNNQLQRQPQLLEEDIL
ncbi:MAG: outer membrane lipoprotein carrier protein LolA [Deltaproteobacteria bacterium]|jgi:outer membrane lipoprotein carrier protein|nr:outer membrane lipoprotein carrier protein LolA [Deltaproteobacteria bacterium]